MTMLCHNGKRQAYLDSLRVGGWTETSAAPSLACVEPHTASPLFQGLEALHILNGVFLTD